MNDAEHLIHEAELPASVEENQFEIFAVKKP
jgi:hypothetical protein